MPGKRDQYVSIYLCASFQMPRVMDGAGLVQTRYPMRPRTGRPFSSTTSVAIPGAGAPSVHGFSSCMGSGNRNEPTISVPPEMLMMGQLPPPTRSKYNLQDLSSHGSPVEPSKRSDGIAGSGWSPLIRMRMAVGETPKVVIPCCAIISHKRCGEG